MNTEEEKVKENTKVTTIHAEGYKKNSEKGKRTSE